MNKFDGRVFEKVICFVGKDTKYSARCLKILVEKNIKIISIVGESALELANILPEQQKENIVIIAEKNHG